MSLGSAFACEKQELNPKPEAIKPTDSCASKRRKMASACEPECKDDRTGRCLQRCAEVIYGQPLPVCDDPVEKLCRYEQGKMLDKCRPGCDEQAHLSGKAYDSCLQECAVKVFGKQIPTCSKR